MQPRAVELMQHVAREANSRKAQISGGVVKIGVLNDQSGLYADLTGQGSVVAARMAVEDFGAHPLLRVTDAEGAQRLIPFVAAYIDGVDMAERRVDVDWQPDY